jgi:hypothetical protein
VVAVADADSTKSTTSTITVVPTSYGGTLPADGATGVPVNSTVVLRLLQSALATSINESTVTLNDPQATVPADVTTTRIRAPLR